MQVTWFLRRDYGLELVEPESRLVGPERWYPGADGDSGDKAVLAVAAWLCGALRLDGELGMVGGGGHCETTLGTLNLNLSVEKNNKNWIYFYAVITSGSPI